MSQAFDLEALRPNKRPTLMSLLAGLGIDVSEWGYASNPKYCYKWAFRNPAKFVALNVWHEAIEQDQNGVFRIWDWSKEWPKGERVKRLELIECLAEAFQQGLPVKVILGDKLPRGDKPRRANVVAFRGLDLVDWAVTQFDPAGVCRIERDVLPVNSQIRNYQDELFFEGRTSKRFYDHRSREVGFRKAKIEEAIRLNGSLICEVKECSFDFERAYGAIGAEYAHAHHLTPLSKAPSSGRNAQLSDLAIVCANCHAMIHRGGESRSLDEISEAIARQKLK